MGCTQCASRFEFRIEQVDRDDRPRPAGSRVSSDENPTPPSPTTAARDPASMRAVLKTAPAPVSTAQPNSAASSQARPGSIRTTERDTVAYSAKAEHPMW